MRNGKRGFTLMELLVVISIVSVLLMFSLYCIEGVTKIMKLNNSVRNICNGLRFASYRARADGSPYRLTLKRQKLLIQKRSGNSWLNKDSYDLSELVKVECRGAPVFHSGGFVVPAGSFTLRLKGSSSHLVRITVSSLGRIKVKKRVS